MVRTANRAEVYDVERDTLWGWCGYRGRKITAPRCDMVVESGSSLAVGRYVVVTTHCDFGCNTVWACLRESFRSLRAALADAVEWQRNRDDAVSRGYVWCADMEIEVWHVVKDGTLMPEPVAAPEVPESVDELPVILADAITERGIWEKMRTAGNLLEEANWQVERETLYEDGYDHNDYAELLNYRRRLINAGVVPEHWEDTAKRETDALAELTECCKNDQGNGRDRLYLVSGQRLEGDNGFIEVYNYEEAIKAARFFSHVLCMDGV